MKIIKLTAILSLAAFASILAYNEPVHAAKGSKGGNTSNLPTNPPIDFILSLEDELGNLITDSDGNLENNSGRFLNVIQDFSYSKPDSNFNSTDIPYFKDEAGNTFFFNSSGDLSVDFLANVNTINGVEDVISYQMEVKSKGYTFYYDFFFTETDFNKAGITNVKDELVNSLSGFDKLVNQLASNGKLVLQGSLLCDGTKEEDFLGSKDTCKKFDENFYKNKFPNLFNSQFEESLGIGLDPDNDDFHLNTFTEIDKPDSKTVPESSSAISLLALGIVGIGSVLKSKIVKI